MKDSIDSPMVEMIEKIHGELDGSVTNDKTDDDDDDATRILTICPSLMLIPMKRETATRIPVTETRSQRQSKRKGALDTANEAAVPEVLVGNLYRDKATVVAGELDFLDGVETKDTVKRSS
jgi:hypothetical protein